MRSFSNMAFMAFVDYLVYYFLLRPAMLHMMGVYASMAQMMDVTMAPH